MRRQFLTDDELTTLIELARAENFLPLHFGPSGAWLDRDDPSAAWALELLAS